MQKLQVLSHAVLVHCQTLTIAGLIIPAPTRSVNGGVLFYNRNFFVTT